MRVGERARNSTTKIPDAGDGMQRLIGRLRKIQRGEISRVVSRRNYPFTGRMAPDSTTGCRSDIFTGMRARSSRAAQ